MKIESYPERRFGERPPPPPFLPKSWKNPAPRLVAVLLFALGLCATLLAVAADGAAVEAEADFVERLYPFLEQAQCRLCHNDNGIATATRLQFPPAEAAPERILAFGHSLAGLISKENLEQSPLWLKPTARIAHTGGERIHPGSEAERLLRQWIDHLASLSPDEVAERSRGAEPGPATAAAARRLTHSQYNNSVRDLLRAETRRAESFPPEDFVDGFSNQLEGQSVSPLLAEAYSEAARKLARSAFLGGDSSGLVPCEPEGVGDAGCRAAFVQKFGRRAFRRPLAEPELAAYQELFAGEAERAGSFYAGAQAVVEAMLQSPNFLYYGHERSRSHQLASRLAYFLWNTTPHEELLEAADAGTLDDPAAAEAVVRRMLDDPRAHEAFDEFLAQWLRFDRLLKAVRDVKLYPEFSVELAGAMAEETRQLFRQLVWGNGDFREFFTAPYGYLNADLARLYEVEPPVEAFGRVELPPESGRAGVLGQASFLTVTSKPGESSPTERGLFLREHFLCQIVPPPPPGVNTTLPPVTDEKPATNREQLEMHLTNSACAGCHRLIDPIGFGFERYDAIGRSRDKQLVRIFPTADEQRTKRKTEPTEYRLPIDASGHIQGLTAAAFSTPREAGEILAAEPVCQRCVVKQLFRYAVGRKEAEADQAAIDEAYERFRDSRFHFRELIIAIATSEPFGAGGD